MVTAAARRLSRVYSTERANTAPIISIVYNRNDPNQCEKLELVRDGWSAEHETVESLTESVVTVHLHPGAARKVIV